MWNIESVGKVWLADSPLGDREVLQEAIRARAGGRGGLELDDFGKGELGLLACKVKKAFASGNAQQAFEAGNQVVGRRAATERAGLQTIFADGDGEEFAEQFRRPLGRHPPKAMAPDRGFWGAIIKHGGDTYCADRPVIRKRANGAGADESQILAKKNAAREMSRAEKPVYFPTCRALLAFVGAWIISGLLWLTIARG